MSRTILHSDMNCFYASVEMLHHPELAGKPMAVGGDPEARHGIVLTANYIAKRAGVKTGMALWQARQVCPEIIFVPPRMDLYLRFSRMAQEIYSEYTDQREPFGIDESWLDVTASTSIKGDGMKIAKEISSRIKYELGVTVSIGVSWNKIFAKLGSDYKKPDAITEFSKDNYKDIAWKLPVGDLLMVGRSTERTMKKLGICTIGDLAGAEPSILETYLGKMGLVLHTFANGWDKTPVSVEGYRAPIKSIGNSTTTPRDLVSELDVKIILMALSESVGARLRENGFQLAFFIHRNHFQRDPFTGSLYLPGNDIGMVFHHRNDHFVTGRHTFVGKAGSNQVDRLCRPTRENNLVGRAGVQELLHGLACILMRFRRRLAQEMNAAVNIGIHIIIATLDLFHHTAWLLGCRSVVEVNKRLIVYLMIQNREILPDRLYI